MPTLPSISVTDAQYARLAAVIPGDTPTEKANAYKAIVKDMLRRMVIDADVRAAHKVADAAIQEAVDAARDDADNL